MKSSISRKPNQQMQKASAALLRSSKRTVKNQQAVSVTKTIGEEFDEIISTIPEKILESLPTDGAERHDFYLHRAR